MVSGGNPGESLPREHRKDPNTAYCSECHKPLPLLPQPFQQLLRTRPWAHPDVSLLLSNSLWQDIFLPPHREFLLKREVPKSDFFRPGSARNAGPAGIPRASSGLAELRKPELNPPYLPTPSSSPHTGVGEGQGETSEPCQNPTLSCPQHPSQRSTFAYLLQLGLSELQESPPSFPLFSRSCQCVCCTQ